MCKVLQDIGLITEHGSKALKFQKIINDNKEKTLAFVSYKDGMTVKVYEYTKDEIRNLQELLCDYLDYHPVFEVETETETEEVDTETEVEDKPTGVLHSLTTLPSGDTNYQSALKKATVDEIATAINLMEESGGRHQTRIRVCKAELDRRAKRPVGTTESEDKLKTKAKVETNIEPKEPEPKVVTFPTEDKMPKIIPLHTEGERTYGECVAKATKEKEMFTDDDSQYVIIGLLELCKVDQDFRNNFMREDKSYGDFMEYMFKVAQNGYCVKYGNVGWLSRDLGLALAIDYYNNDSEKQKEIEDAERAKKAEEAKKKAEALKKEVKKNGKKVGRKKGRTTA